MAHKVVYVKTIGTCNLNCDHCFTNGSSGDKTQFNVDDTLSWLSSYVDAVGPDHDWHIELHGGEPFLVKLPKLLKFTDTVKKILPNATIGCTSNLTFPLTPDHVTFIRDTLGGMIGTSWDPFIRWETASQYKMWLESLRRLRHIDIYPKVNVTITKRLLTEYTPKQFIETMIGIGVKTVELERLTMDGTAVCNANTIFPDNDLQDKWFLELLEYYQLYEINKTLNIDTIDGLLARLENNLVKTGTNCRNCEQNLVTINSNGTLSTCPNAAESVNYSSIQDDVGVFLTHDHRAMSQATEQSFDPRCVSCDVFDLCGGDCHRLHWDDRCGGWKRTLHKLSNRPYVSNLIIKV